MKDKSTKLNNEIKVIIYNSPNEQKKKDFIEKIIKQIKIVYGG